MTLTQISSGQLYLGVDGGGTKCRMRLTDAKLNILAEEIINRPVNLQLQNGEIAYAVILELSKKIFAKAGLDIRKFEKKTYCCFGLAGARLEKAKQSFSKRLFPFAKIHICDDIDIAQAGAFLGKDGAVLIIGTGSAGLAIIDDKRLQVGGWGFYISDDMSGAILGRELLRKSLMAHEGLIKKTPLSKEIMSKFNNKPEELMAFSFGNGETNKPARPADYAKFAPIIFDYYEKNDPLANELMELELNMIEKYINWFQQHKAKQIAIAGGLGKRLLPILQQQFGSVIIKPKSAPLNGAIIIAQQKFNSKC